MRATPSGGPAGSDNRWQGYTHQELYDMLHSGPGTRAAGLTADTWSGLSGALADIQQDISIGVSKSGAAWTGAAADSARDALGPLGDWAQQASAAAELMQLSTTMQGELLDKARSDMPAPVPPPQPGDFTPIRQLMSARLDAEQIEAAHDAAAQRAFQVMIDYESGTTDNTSTLGEFGTPPKLVVDTSPITGIPLSRSGDDPLDARGRTFRPIRPTTRVRPAGLTEEEPLPERDTPAPPRSSAATEEPATEEPATEPTPESTESTPETGRPADPTRASATPEPPATATPEAEPQPERVTTPAPTSGTVTPKPRRTAPHDQEQPRLTPSNRPAQNQPSQNRPANPTTPSAATSSDTGHPAPAPAPEQPVAGAPIVPASRGARLVEDEIIQPNVLILGEDIYGAQSYTAPVIGE